MCNQTVSLVAAELERQGVVTVALQLLRRVAEQTRPPRALLVPFRHGYPLHWPAAPGRQCRVLEAALRLLEDDSLKPPVLAEFDPLRPPAEAPCPEPEAEEPVREREPAR